MTLRPLAFAVLILMGGCASTIDRASRFARVSLMECRLAAFDATFTVPPAGYTLTAGPHSLVFPPGAVDTPRDFRFRIHDATYAVVEIIPVGGGPAPFEDAKPRLSLDTSTCTPETTKPLLIRTSSAGVHILPVQITAVNAFRSAVRVEADLPGFSLFMLASP